MGKDKKDNKKIEEIEKELEGYRQVREDQFLVDEKKKYVFSSILSVFNKYLIIWSILLFVILMLLEQNLAMETSKFLLIFKYFAVGVNVIIFGYSISTFIFYNKEKNKKDVSEKPEIVVDKIILGKIKNIAISALLLSVFLFLFLATSNMII